MEIHPTHSECFRHPWVGPSFRMLLVINIITCFQIKQQCRKVPTIMASVSEKFTLKEFDVVQNNGLATMREMVKDPKAVPPLLYSDRLGVLGVS